MKYDFDKVIDRNGTAAVKLEEAKEVWGRADLIPLWVADMDFGTAPLLWMPFVNAVNVKCWVIRGNLTVTIGQSLIG